jgi:BirA family biotin operon repressor/biotin-[acetyl-CoA-carboxylase] ligase
MNNKVLQLLKLLSDCQTHSGEELGELLGVSRAAVWKQLKQITELGFVVESLRGRGYRLAAPVDLIDIGVLSKGLCNQHHFDCEVHLEIDSTNSQLLRLLQQSKILPSGYCVVAEMQTAGRGRRGKQWCSPFAKNLYFSMLWNFDNGMVALEGLSLVVGISLAQTLESLGIDNIGLKWPNDLLIDNYKIAGVLLEVLGESTGFCQVVMGVGLNVYMSESEQVAINQKWISLDRVYDGEITRTKLLALIVERLLFNLRQFQYEGFGSFVNEWKRLDVFLGKDVSVITNNEVVLGVADGVSASGELQVSTYQGKRVFNSGEVSLRLVL